MTTDSNEYRDGILQAWQGEHWGKAFFDQVAERTDDAGHRAKWEVLGQLEEATGNALTPLVGALVGDSAKPDPEGYRQVEGFVDAYAKLSWAEALEQMMTLLDPAIERLERLLVLAPDEDRDTVQILVDHEIALKRFAQRELAGDPETSLEPVRAVIERARAAQPTT